MSEKTSTVQSATAPKTRKRPYRLKLYGDLVCRYRFHPERTVKTRSAYRLEAVLYKGKKWIRETKTQYAVGRKRESESLRKPGVPPLPPPISIMEKTLCKLLYSDTIASGILRNGGSTGSQSLSISMAEYWLSMHKQAESMFWGNDAEEAIKEKRLLMTRMMLCFGEFDLTRFLRKDNMSDAEYDDALHAACDEIRGYITRMPGDGGRDRLHEIIIRRSYGDQVSLDQVAESRGNTQTVREYSHTLWNVVSRYVRDKDPSVFRKVATTYAKRFNPHKNAGKAITANMKQRTLSLREYRELYDRLVKKQSKGDIPAVNIAILMCLLMGMQMKEVCALDTKDILPIEGYLHSHCVQVYKQMTKEKAKYTITEIPEDKRVRCIPIPSEIYKLLAINKNDGPLFLHALGKRLTPDDVKREMKKLFSGGRSLKIYRDTGDREIDLGYIVSDAHSANSASALWRRSGLADDEIRYLCGHSPNNTVSKNYIDYENAHKKYAMLAQMDLAISEIVCENREPLIDPIMHEFSPLRENAQNLVIPGVPRHTIVGIMNADEPMRIDIRVGHGATIVCRPR